MPSTLRLFLLCLTVGCETHAPSPGDYDNTCETVDDCEVVVWWSHCGCDFDSWYALNKDAAPVFEADQESYYERHPCKERCALGPLPLPTDESLAELACEEGVCTSNTYGPNYYGTGTTPYY